MSVSRVPSSPPELKEAIRRRAQDAGFDSVGFTAARGDARDRLNLEAYIAEGRHGDMTWMATTADRRVDPEALWPEARTVVAVGVSYAPGEDPLAATTRPDRAAISVYAQGRDYHGVLKTRLKAFGRWLTETHTCDARVFVDTAPVMEKPIAQRAGLGWIGKHTNLVSRRFGSWLFLGEVFTTLELPPDAPEVDHCGTCDRCLRACPTGALPAPYRIDPTRCISYLTIEHARSIDAALEDRMGNRVYGCDDCLAVCPWNRFATPTSHDDLRPRAELMAPRLLDLAALDDAAFRSVFAGSAVKRTGRDRMVRNVTIAAGNVGATEIVDSAAQDASALVRDAAGRAARRCVRQT